MVGVILAGGSGTRFWPLSRRERPKQLLKLFGGQPMIAHTVQRLDGLIGVERTLIVCGPHLVEPIREALPQLPPENLIVEPLPRNTAPAIGLAATVVAERFGEDEVMVVLPSDHFIAPRTAFQSCLRVAAEAAAQGPILTLGIPPTRPETGYGYIRQGAAGEGGGPIRPVEAFVEKPSLAKALAYLGDERFLWNSGMFLLTARTMLDECARQLPELAGVLQTIRGHLAAGAADEAWAEAFASAPDISIDYGIMEGAPRVEVVPATFQWSDVGHWAALPEIHDPNEEGNVVRAPATLIDVSNSILYSQDGARHMGVVGVDDLIVVDTPDALLIVPRHKAQRVREVVAALKEAGLDDLI